MLNISCTYYHLNVFLKVFIRLKTDPVFLTSLRDNIELLFFAKLLSLSSQSYRLYIFLWWYCSQTWSISGSSSWMNRDQVFLNLSSRETPPHDIIWQPMTILRSYTATVIGLDVTELCKARVSPLCRPQFAAFHFISWHALIL